MRHTIDHCLLMVTGLLPLIYVQANPHPMITPGPVHIPHIEARQDSGPNVYGYIDGDINSPLGCGAGYQWQSVMSGIGACCNELRCTSAVFACANSGEPDPCEEYSYFCTAGMLTGLSCKSPTPSCFQYMRVSDAQDTSPDYILRCGTASAEIQVLVTPTNEAEATLTSDRLSIAASGDAQDESFVASTGTRNSKSPTRSNSNIPSEETAGSNPTSSNNNQSSSNTLFRVIIGIVAGLVVIALIVGAIFLHKRLKKIKKSMEFQKLPENISSIQTVIGGGSDAGRSSVTAWSEGVASSAGSSYGGQCAREGSVYYGQRRP